MAARNSSSSYKFQTFVTLLCRYRVVSSGSRWGHQTHHRDLPPYRLDQGLRFLSANSRAQNQSKFEMEKDQIGKVQVQPAFAAPPKFGISSWVKWLLGSIVSLLLPLWKNKWDYLLTFEEKVVKEVEVVEKVATIADKALEEVVNQLPDNSKLKEAAQVMEHVSSAAVHDAQLIENIISKVDDVKQDLEDLEKIVEPIVDKIIQGKTPKN